MDEDELGAAEDEPNYENIPDEKASEQTEWLRIALGVIALLIILALVAVPIFRVLAANGGGDQERGTRDARLFVAQQFTTAILERRSTSRAVFWAPPELHADIDRVVAYLQTRDPQQLDGAEVSLARVACMAGQERHFDRPECFQAWLRKPGAAEVVRIAFVVAIADNAARVVALSRLVNAALSHPATPLD
jgi:hypothetical protein